MQTYGINSLLGELVTLTKERDDLSLQVSLIKTLTHFINSAHATPKKSVVIYLLKDVKKQTISVLTAENTPDNAIVSADLKQAILNCIQTDSRYTYQSENNRIIKLHPMRGVMGHIDCVIAVESDQIDEYLDVSICMILEIYQNFVLLNNENECDTLTGLLNRKTFDFKINKILAQMHSSTNRKEDKADQIYFLAIFDIDHFKRINDEFGHLIGDEVLLMFSQLMRQSFRETDPLFRFGGEEFVGFFECASTMDIQNIFERFKLKVANFQFPQVGKVTVSAGFTEISPFDTSSQIIDRADTALYYAKNHGRNRVDSYELLIADGSLQENKKEGEIELF
ncbi:MAG: GGDEF domain-containing protein [Methylotenera sp.]|uniref:GGDEF domain-containing protein n=1 Tax=Methylotenera sp. TaxID=2051956 RepID=UPI00271568BD|nr:GGDEF domain-containing protein [Methylotenera sp.]MDO9151932.1 GGDEF domain-containing protein [Methylotenera sp.]